MSALAAIRITNIVSVTQGGSQIEGVRMVKITADKGKLLAILAEGDLYPTGAENVGTSDFPVQTESTYETDPATALAAIALAVDDLVIVYVSAQGGGNKTITIANHQFRQFSHSQELQQFGKPPLQGVAFSSDGSSLPITAS